MAKIGQATAFTPPRLWYDGSWVLERIDAPHNPACPAIDSRATVMEPDKGDTNLLFGILAMKMNFIRQDDLLEAMGIWFLDRQKTLGQILTERLAISPKDCDLLNSMVRDRHPGGLAGRLSVLPQG
jgi:hypothetical protein